MIFKFNRLTSVLCLSTMLVASAVSVQAQEIKKGLSIAFLPKQINNPYNVITGGNT